MSTGLEKLHESIMRRKGYFGPFQPTDDCLSGKILQVHSDEIEKFKTGVPYKAKGHAVFNLELAIIDVHLDAEDAEVPKHGSVVFLRQPASHRIPFEYWKQLEKPWYVIEIQADGSVHAHRRVQFIANPLRQHPLCEMTPTNYWEFYEEMQLTIN